MKKGMEEPDCKRRQAEAGGGVWRREKNKTNSIK